MLKYDLFYLKDGNPADINIHSRLPDSWVNELRQGPWYRIFLPKALKGEQLSLPEGLEVLYQTARINGSLGWRVNLGAGAGFFAGSMPLETAQQIYEVQGSIVAGSGAVTGRAERREDGWSLSGRWAFCTGSLSATAFTVNARISDGEVRTFILRPEQVKIEKYWPYWALKATETYSVKTTGALVPMAWSFVIGRQNSFPEYSLYNLDFMLFARFCMAASLLGMADGFLEAYREFTNSLDRSSLISIEAKREFEEHHSIFRSNLFSLAELSVISQESSKQKSIDASLADLFQKLKPLLEIKSLEIIRSTGLAGMDETKVLHQSWRDFLLAGQHFLYK